MTRPDWVKDSLDTDSLAEALEERVARLEEITASRWPRRWLLRARYGRELRRSVRHFPGKTFAERRAGAASADWLSRYRLLLLAVVAVTWGAAAVTMLRQVHG